MCIRDSSRTLHCLPVMPRFYTSKQSCAKGNILSRDSAFNSCLRTEMGKPQYPSVSKNFPFQCETKTDREKTVFNKRNIYKSIIRSMLSYLRKNRKNILLHLAGEGHSLEEVEGAFAAIESYRKIEEPMQSKRRFQNLVEDIIRENSIATYILKESLVAAINCYDKGNAGKVTPENLKGYKSLYMECLNRARNRLEGKEGQ
eukprot:TRINITY_DN576_c0_g2_i2.p1 TRINITY_DN576_c0_g2~~TRINITY_DN576_c0_g2_i2.p1  ORF type:complete len:217 (+),score=32.32 TRINITY_DN576_c0_g2_i2:49-651(+)